MIIKLNVSFDRQHLNKLTAELTFLKRQFHETGLGQLLFLSRLNYEANKRKDN
jgi:hypothetical protein